MGDSELSMNKGDDLPYTLTFKDSNGVVIDITGWTVCLMVKKDINDSDATALITKLVTSHTNPTQGVTTITIDRVDTKDLDVGAYSYNIRIIKDTGKYKSSSVDNFILKSVVKTGD